MNLINAKNLLRFIQAGILFLTVIVPLAYWNSTMYPFLTLKVVLFQSLVELIGAAWLILILFWKTFRLRWTPLSVVVLVFIGVLFLSALLGIDFWRSFWSTQARLVGLFYLLHVLLLFFILSAIRPFCWHWLWWLSLATAFLGTIMGFLEKFITIDLFTSRDYGRASSLFGNPSFLAGYLLFNVFIGLYLFYETKNKWLKIVAFLGALIAAGGIFLTQTIGALIGLFAGIFILLIYFVVYFHQVKTPKTIFFRNILISLLIALVLLGGIFFFTKNSSFWKYIPGISRLTEVNLASSNLQNRLIAWRAGWQSFLDKPLLGWGWENFNVMFNRFYNPILLTANFSETYWDKPHNLFLEYLYTTGIIGLISFLALLAAFFYETFKARLPALVFFVAGLISYLIQALVIFDTPGVLLMLVFYLAYVDYHYRQQLFIKEKS